MWELPHSHLALKPPGLLLEMARSAPAGRGGGLPVQPDPPQNLEDHCP